MTDILPTNASNMLYRPEYEQFVRMYEVRHAELRVEIKEIETNLRGDFQTLNNKVDALSNSIDKKSGDVWKIIATNVMSFAAGVSVYVALHALNIIH